MKIPNEWAKLVASREKKVWRRGHRGPVWSEGEMSRWVRVSGVRWTGEVKASKGKLGLGKGKGGLEMGR